LGRTEGNNPRIMPIPQNGYGLAECDLATNKERNEP
jgi:hypothetical protein